LARKPGLLLLCSGNFILTIVNSVKYDLTNNQMADSIDYIQGLPQLTTHRRS